MRTVLAMLVAAGAAADKGDDVLKIVDRSMNDFADQTIEISMRVVEPDGSARERKFTAWQKGGRKRLVRFTAPADVKGTAVLTESRDSMYVYLPAFKRVRRIAGHTRSQSFLGSDFSYEDMGSVTLPEIYTAKLVGEDAEQWRIELAPRDPDDISYGKLVMWISKKVRHYTRVEYFDKQGKKVKTLVQSDFVYYPKDDDHYPRSAVMTDHRRNDHRTELTLKVVSTNAGLSDDLFTPRALSRGP